jgi:hypothetical protein
LIQAMLGGLFVRGPADALDRLKKAAESRRFVTR